MFKPVSTLEAPGPACNRKKASASNFFKNLCEKVILTPSGSLRELAKEKVRLSFVLRFNWVAHNTR